MLTSEALSRARLSLSEETNNEIALVQVSRIETEPTEAVGGEVFHQIEHYGGKTFEESCRGDEHRNDEEKEELPNYALSPYNSQEYIDALASGNTYSATSSSQQLNYFETRLKPNSMVSSNRNSATTATSTNYSKREARPSSSDQRATKELYETLNSIIGNQTGMTYSDDTAANFKKCDHQSDREAQAIIPQLTVSDFDAKTNHQFEAKESPEQLIANSSKTVIKTSVRSSIETRSPSGADLARYHGYDSTIDGSTEYYKKEFDKFIVNNPSVETCSNQSSKQSGHCSGGECDIFGKLSRETSQSLSATTCCKTVSRKSSKRLKHRGHTTSDEYSGKLMIETPRYLSATSTESGSRDSRWRPKKHYYTSSEESHKKITNVEPHPYSAASSSESINHKPVEHQGEHSTYGSAISGESLTFLSTLPYISYSTSNEFDDRVKSDDSVDDLSSKNHFNEVSLPLTAISKVSSTRFGNKSSGESLNSLSEKQTKDRTLTYNISSNESLIERSVKTNESDYTVQKSERLGDKSNRSGKTSLAEHLSKPRGILTPIESLSSAESLSDRSVLTNDSDYTVQKSERLGDKSNRSGKTSLAEHLSKPRGILTPIESLSSAESLSDRSVLTNDSDYTVQKSERLGDKSNRSGKTSLAEHLSKPRGILTPIESLSSAESLSDRSVLTNDSDYTVQKSERLGDKSNRSGKTSLAEHLSKPRGILTPIESLSSLKV